MPVLLRAKIAFLRRSSFIFCLFLSAGCNQVSPPPPHPGEPQAFKPYRFDDEFPTARLSASSTPSSALVTDPIIWHNFNSEKDVTWNPLRGRMGLRRGDLVVKGENNTPVIMSPKNPPISWGLYRAIEIRMMTEGGREVQLKIGEQEWKHKLGSPGEYHVYHFDLDRKTPAETQPLLIMPTDSLNDMALIHSIELIPRKADFPQAAGRTMAGKGEEYRNAIYVHAPASLMYQVNIPKAGVLHFGMGIAEKNAPITFRVTANAQELYSKTLDDRNIWQDAEVDLSKYAGRVVALLFEAKSEKPGAVGFWANPLLTTKLPKNRPNVLIYMIDTLRADHTSLYGYARETTPFLKKLGAQGLVFEDCTAQATWTKPSVASLMTSLYSFTHAIADEYDTIPKSCTTLAGQLRSAGYVTGSVVTNPSAGRITGLERGFDYMAEWQVPARYLNDARDRGTDSAALNHVLFEWLDKHRDEPFFLYAHATDPHAPYRPPAGFEEKFAKAAETPAFNRDFLKLRQMAVAKGGFGISRALATQGGVNPDRFIARAIDRYDGEVLHNDASLEQLAGKLKALGILDNTLVIVVSDHGEEFWDHGWTGHGQSLYPELSHVVLMMWNPKMIRTQARVTEPVQLIDVMPTVLDLAGLKIPEGVEGQSLASFAKGGRFERRTPVMTSRFAHPYSQRHELDPENHIDSVALLEKNWKLIYREKGASVGLAKVELYDRRTDRTDSNNVAAKNPQQVERMMGQITTWTSAQKQARNALGRGTKAPLDPETAQKLRSLGYLGGK